MLCQIHGHGCARSDGVASDFFVYVAKYIWPQLSCCPTKAVEDSCARDVLNLLSFVVLEGIYGDVDCCVGEIKGAVGNTSPEMYGAVQFVYCFVLSDSVMVHVILLGDEGDGDGIECSFGDAE